MRMQPKRRAARGAHARAQALGSIDFDSGKACAARRLIADVRFRPEADIPMPRTLTIPGCCLITEPVYIGLLDGPGSPKIESY